MEPNTQLLAPGRRARRALVGLVTLSILLLQTNLAEAHQDPAGCNSTGVSITLGVFRADGTTAVGAGTLADGEKIVYKTTLAKPAGACAFEGGQITIDVPGPVGSVDVTPNGGIPCIGGSAPSCVTSVDSKPVVYIVDHSHETTVGGNQRVTAETEYGGGVTHDASPDDEGPTGSTTKSNIVVHPDLHVTKTPDGGTVEAGNNASFTIKVTNDGAAPADDMKLDDDLPNNGGLGWVENPELNACQITNSHLHCEAQQVPIGGSFTVTVTTPTSEANAGKLSNTACVTTSSHEMHGTGDGSADNCDNADITILTPNLLITKKADASPVSTGDPIGFTVTLKNQGPGKAFNTEISDPLPSGSGISWSITPAYSGQGTCSVTGSPPNQNLGCDLGTLAVGGSVSVHIGSGTTGNSAGTYPNTATGDASNAPAVQASATIIVQAPGLKITKTADRSPVSTTEAIGFTIGVSNSGPGSAKGATLNDPLPGGPGVSWSISPSYAGPGTCAIAGSAPNQTLTCSFGDLAAGSSLSLHIASATTANSAGTYDNTATTQATNAPPVSATATVVVIKPILSITKKADQNLVSTGQDIGFTITVKNVGQGIAFNSTLSDPLPAGGSGSGVNWKISPAYGGPGTCAITGSVPTQSLACSFGDLAPGDSASIHISSRTTVGFSGTVKNTATAVANNAPPVQATDTIVVQAPSLAITKTADAPIVNTTEAIGFTIKVSNGGPATATAVTLSDPIPGGSGINWSISPAYAGPGTCAITGSAPSQALGCSFGDMAAGSIVSVHIASGTTIDSAGTYNNTATAVASNSPPKQASATVVVRGPILTITKTADASPVATTQPIGFSISVANIGNGTAFSATLNDPLPGGPGISWSLAPAFGGPGTCAISGTAPSQTLSCSFGDLTPGSGAVLHIASGTTTASAGTYDNTATTRATNHGPVSATAEIIVNSPKLVIAKKADKPVISAGEDMGFTITVGNTGAGTATNVTLNDPLPGGDGIDWLISPAYTGPGTCTIAGSPPLETLKCSFGDLAAGGTVSVHVLTHTDHQCGGTYENTATANADNNPDGAVSAYATVTILKPSLSESAAPDSANVTGGNQIGFKFTTSNGGPGKLFDVTLSAPLPTGSGISWSVDHYTGPGTCAIASGTLNCSFGDTDAYSSIVVHITSPTTAASKGTYVVTGTARSRNSTIEQATASLNVLGVAQPFASKKGCPSTVAPGGVLTYAITIGNNGNAPATGVFLTDRIPTGTTLIESSGGTAAPDSKSVTWSLGSLAEGVVHVEIVRVKVDAGDGSILTNTVSLITNEAAPVVFNVDTLVSLAGAATSGTSYGLDAKPLAAELNKQATTASAPNGPKDQSGSILTVGDPAPGTIGVIEGTSHSEVTNNGSTSTATARLLHVNLLDGAITADALYAVSHSAAGVNGASFDSTGSKIVNLTINDQKIADVTMPNTVIEIPGVAKVILYEETGATTGGTLNHAEHAVNMLHVILLGGAGEIIVSHAETAATSPTGAACTPSTPSGDGGRAGTKPNPVLPTLR